MPAPTLSLTLGHVRTYSGGVSGKCRTLSRSALVQHHAFLHHVLLLPHAQIFTFRGPYAASNAKEYLQKT